MAYFEFYNLPKEENWSVQAPSEVTPAGERKHSGMSNPFAELGKANQLQIQVDLSTVAGGRWRGKGPDWVCCTITRPVRTRSNQPTGNVKESNPGDLVFYRLALLSKSRDWRTDVSGKEQWPKLYVELDVQAGTRLKLWLQRIVVDNWDMQFIPNTGEVVETVTLRAWALDHSLESGNQLRVALGNTPE